MNTKLLLTLGASALLACQPVIGQNLTSGLAGYWTFDTGSISTDANGVSDSAGTANGTLTGATITTGTAGIAGQSVKLSSTANPRPYISIGANNTATSPLTATDASFTISLWFNSSTVSTYQTLLNFGNAGSNVQGIILVIDGGKAGIRAKSGTGADDKIGLSSAALSNNTWYHLVAVFDSQNKIVTGYLNGIGSGTTGSTTNAAGESLANGWVTGASGGQTNNIIGTNVVFGTSATALLVGSNAAATSMMQGMLDEVAIWNRALSAAEVTALYQGQLSGQGISSIPEPSSLTAASAIVALIVAAMTIARRRRD